jgi:hypothetical protein
MADFDLGFCVPVLFIVAVLVAIIAYVATRVVSHGEIPRSKSEMNRFISGQEDTYLVCLDYGIIGKQVGTEYNVTRDHLQVYWSPIGDISGKKFHLPTPLPSACFDIPAIRLNPACGMKKLKFILPYEEDTQLMFLKPLLKENHELKIQLSDQRYINTETKRILYATKFSTDAIDFIADLERGRRPMRGASTILKEGASESPQLPPAQQQQRPPMGQQPQQ